MTHHHYHDAMLPDFIQCAAARSICFDHIKSIDTFGDTLIHQTKSMHPKYLYQINDLRLTEAEYISIEQFFLARSGCIYAFKFRDYLDCAMQSQIIARQTTGTTFQIVKTYGDNAGFCIRKITKLFNDTLRVHINNTLVTHYHTDNVTGIITLHNPINQSDVITVDCNFYIEVRFKTNILSPERSRNGDIVIKNLELLEV